MKITVIPAIDLKDGKCVRLRQGRADDVVAYSEDPVGMARHWVDEGAHYLHVVDLDGAFQGKPVHAEVIGRICKAIKIPVEVGGGLRSDRDIEQMLTLGVTRVILARARVRIRTCCIVWPNGLVMRWPWALMRGTGWCRSRDGRRPRG